MGAVVDVSERRERAHKEAEAFYEPQLSSLGLSVAAIENQDLKQLRSTLERVNELIANPSQLGTFKLTLSTASIVVSKGEATIEIGALPLLLQRKRLVLDRIAALGGEAKASSLRDLVSEVKDSDIRTLLSNEVDQLEEQAKEYRQEKQQVENAEHLEEIRLQRRYSEARLDMERRERRAALRQQFLARESVATIVGGFLLLIFSGALIVAMFFGTTVPTILSNGFFIILGYFFGQSAGRAAARTSASSTNVDLDT